MDGKEGQGKDTEGSIKQCKVCVDKAKEIERRAGKAMPGQGRNH